MKVFGIGLSRTGTTSLDAALELLGYRVRHFPSLSLLLGRLGIKNRELRQYDALTDRPVTHFYKPPDARFPGTKVFDTKQFRQVHTHIRRK